MIIALKIENGEVMIKTHDNPEWHYRRTIVFSDPIYPTNWSQVKIDWIIAKDFEKSLDVAIEDLKYTIPQLKNIYCSCGGDFSKNEAQARWIGNPPGE